MRPAPRFFAAFVFVASVGLLPSACGQEPAKGGAGDGAHGARDIVNRTPDAATGRALFVEKSCVSCHAVNGVGGKAAPALDASTELDPIDPVGFAARMWRGAPAMVELQSLELGYAIWLDADEIVDLAAFAADAEEQRKLTLASVPEEIQDTFLDEMFWEMEDWTGFLEKGQEGAGDPPSDQE